MCFVLRSEHECQILLVSTPTLRSGTVSGRVFSAECSRGCRCTGPTSRRSSVRSHAPPSGRPRCKVNCVLGIHLLQTISNPLVISIWQSNNKSLLAVHVLALLYNNFYRDNNSVYAIINIIFISFDNQCLWTHNVLILPSLLHNVSQQR